MQMESELGFIAFLVIVAVGQPILHAPTPFPHSCWMNCAGREIFTLSQVLCSV